MTRRNTILVTGATGTVGRPLVARLAADSNLRVRALVRDPAKAGELAGAELARGDFSDAQSLVAAMDGIDTLVLITASNANAATQSHAAIAAAQQAGVRKIVRLSAIKADPNGPTDNTRQHGRTEAEIRATGLTHVFLRPSAFMQNILWSARQVLGEGRIYQGYGAAKVGLIDTRDVVDALAAAATRDDFDGQTLELTGPRSVGQDDVATTLAGALGRDVNYVPVAPEQVGEALRGMGADEWTVQLVIDYSRAYASGWGDNVTDAVQRMTGHPARDLDAFVREVFVPATRGS
ncbi:MAG TPA: NAD(P)H-binding protein [Nannocystaceae bacterium]|nr:NAD(P)H-binding protein [Nannocystaceae bacterium]